ncbi:MAG TPA: phasin family protein [Balneolales bacterium]|nr:phasin family protein [Balneolales bacterium]
MATKSKGKKDENLLIQFQDEVSSRSRDIWLAGLGAFATIEEEGSKFFNNLVDRGKKREKKSKEQLDEVYKKIEESQKDVSSRLEETMDMIEKKFEGVLDRMGVPTRNEVHDLMKKVDKLSDRVDTLSKNMEKGSTTTKSTQKTK